MEEGAIDGNSGNDEYGDPEVLNNVGLGHLLVLFWTKTQIKTNEGRYYYEVAIDPNEYHIIGCDEEETRKLLLYRSHFLGSPIRSYADGTNCKGVIDRVYKNDRPEMSPNISFYSEDEYPHLHFALSCGILSSFCFPFNVSGSRGVMEIVSTCNQDVQGLVTFSKSIKGFHRVCQLWRLRDLQYQKYDVQPVPEIDRLLEVVSQTFHLPLTQYWTRGYLHLHLVRLFSYRTFENLAPWCQFKDACYHTSLGLGHDQLGNLCEKPGAFYCRDITALSITQYPLAHYARNCGSIPCFTINLCKKLSSDCKWILRFFLPAQEMDNDYPHPLLNSIWEKIKDCLPDYKLDSGEQLGQVLSVKVINSSAHSEPESFKIGQHVSSLPHLEVSEYTRTSNLFENNSGKRSNSFSYEEAAAGETSKRVPNEAFQPRTSEEHFEIRGNAVAGERGTEQSSIFFQKAATGKTPKRTTNEASRPRRSEEYFETTGNTVADDRVDNRVEVSSDEDVEYAVTTESKRYKKSIIPFTKENVSEHFGKPLIDVAEIFGVSKSTVKRRCRSLGITWWKPSKRKLIATEEGKQNVSSSMRPLQDTPVHRSQASEKMTVKATYNGVTIKFGLTNSSGISELEDNVIKRLHLEKNSFSIKYQDTDDELILIGCDEDVQECMEFSRMAEKATIKMLIHPPVNHNAP